MTPKYRDQKCIYAYYYFSRRISFKGANNKINSKVNV